MYRYTQSEQEETFYLYIHLVGKCHIYIKNRMKRQKGNWHVEPSEVYDVTLNADNVK